jgi:hypothetical protein
MACPYFHPQRRFDDKTWTKPPRLPLGDPYYGLCRVDPMRDWSPDEPTLRELCNLGHARRCSRFPQGPGADAVRFSVVSDGESSLRLFYVREQDHSTLEHGDIECSEAGEILSGPDDAMLRGQARAYAASYLRRKSQPEELARNPNRR